MNKYVILAQEAIRHFLQTGEIMDPPRDLSSDFQRQAGVFVSLFKDGKLRGCIGTFQATKENVAEEIIANAISASQQDPRFSPVTSEEFEELTYEVSILKPLEKMDNIKTPLNMSESELQQAGLDPKTYGVFIKSVHNPGKTGLLLPDIEGVDTVKEQLRVTSLKAGIDLNSEDIEIHRFSVEKHTDQDQD